MEFAAIDIGSNAIRLYLSTLIESSPSPVFAKDSLVRLPIRLGADVFTKGYITPYNENRLLLAMKGYKHLIESYQTQSYLAYATSAMRESKNGLDIIKKIYQETGLKIEIIDGQKEAHSILQNHIEKDLNYKKDYLYIDVGGGSTELTYIHKNQFSASHSFKIGTVRLLQDKTDEKEWSKLKKWLKKHIATDKKIEAIGSGGNINKLFTLAKEKKINKRILYRENLTEIYQLLNSISYAERMEIYKLKPDRADVIIPAGNIYLRIMEWAKIEKIHIPRIGLVDGMIRILYEEYLKKSLKN